MRKQGGINISATGNFIAQTTSDEILMIRNPENSNDVNTIETNAKGLNAKQIEILALIDDKIVKLNQIGKILNGIRNIKNETILQDIDIKDEETRLKMVEPDIVVKDFSKTILAIRLNEEGVDNFDSEIMKLKNELNTEIEITGLLFADAVNSTLHKKLLVSGQIDKIGHKEYQAESKVHFECISAIEQKLDFEMLSDKEFAFMSSEGIAAAHIIKEIEKHNHIIEVLVDADKIKTRKTKKTVIFALTTVIILMGVLAWLTSFLGINLSGKQYALFGVPILVIIWGFIGSFASMIYRFNKKPIHDFGDSVKWLITRPVQGIILSSAFYWVLISSQFIISGGKSADTLVNSDEVILMFSFLIGFSDKFADKAFSTLIEKYINKNSVQDTKIKN